MRHISPMASPRGLLRFRSQSPTSWLCEVAMGRLPHPCDIRQETLVFLRRDIADISSILGLPAVAFFGAFKQQCDAQSWLGHAGLRALRRPHWRHEALPHQHLPWPEALGISSWRDLGRPSLVGARPRVDHAPVFNYGARWVVGISPPATRTVLLAPRLPSGPTCASAQHRSCAGQLSKSLRLEFRNPRWTVTLAGSRCS